MKKCEGVLSLIEQQAVVKLCKQYVGVRPDAVHSIFCTGFSVGFCEGLGAAKRAVIISINRIGGVK
jgi:hypothetical protein